eukprot:TRINITY_DN56722_c0_g1_i1.p1 TRINITY_DN56722_c0_g1~~TRINITY_DN56722_c0_g1_i1.p1  ORF type:complete len:582 (+),score=20.71 TRINITY_DN56722_c0_g1_i1:142-1887(+)
MNKQQLFMAGVGFLLVVALLYSRRENRESSLVPIRRAQEPTRGEQEPIAEPDRPQEDKPDPQPIEPNNTLPAETPPPPPENNVETTAETKNTATIDEATRLALSHNEPWKVQGTPIRYCTRRTELPKGEVIHTKSYKMRPGLANTLVHSLDITSDLFDRFPFACQFSEDELHKKFAKETGLRTLIDHFEKNLEDMDVIPEERRKECLPKFRVINKNTPNLVPLTPLPGTEIEKRKHETIVKTWVSESAQYSEIAPKLCVQPSHLIERHSQQPLRDFYEAKRIKQPESGKQAMNYPGYPFIDGVGFKKLGDYIHETDNWLFGNQKADLNGFLKTRFSNRSLLYWHLEGKDLITLKRRINDFEHHFFLITGSLDEPEFPPWLVDHPKVLRIFAVNVPFEVKDHPKICILPFGQRWTLSEEVNQQRGNATLYPPTKLLLTSFTIGNRGPGNTENKRQARRKLMLPILETGFGRKASEIHFKMNHTQYTRALMEHKFIFSPPGLGLDAYRTWQCFQTGRIPVVKNLLAPDMYDGLPVVILDEWKDITPKLLEAKWKEMSEKTFNLGKLWFPWWVRFILREALAVP